MTAPAFTPSAVRAHILDALAGHDDPRAWDLVRKGDLAIQSMVDIWQGSTGPVHAYRVGLACDAAELGEVSVAPHVVDELVRAAAGAIGRLAPEGQQWTLSDLTLFWRGSTKARATAYRDASPSSNTFADAVEAFLRAQGEIIASQHIANMSFEESGSTVTVGGAPREDRRVVEAGVRALLRGLEGREIRVVWRDRRVRQ